MHRGNQLRIAQTDAHAGKLAGGERPERLRQLVAAVHQVVPRRKPHRNPLADGVRYPQVEARHEAQHHHRQTDHGHAENARARDAVERQKQAAEYQRRAHISLQEEKQQRKRQRRRQPAACIRAAECRCRRVSPAMEARVQSVPSNTALATSVASARVGWRLWVIDSSICVATITGFPRRTALRRASSAGWRCAQSAPRPPGRRGPP